MSEQRLVKTTCEIVFFDFDCPPESYESYGMESGVACRVLQETRDDLLLRPVDHPGWSARVPKDCCRSLSPLELLGEQAE